MSPRKARYVTLCQQVLTLLAVGAVVAPAANILDLDVVRSPDAASTHALESPAPDVPADAAPASSGAVVPAAAGENDTAPVETGTVSADVEETQLTDVSGVAEAENTDPQADPQADPESSPEAPEPSPEAAPDAEGLDGAAPEQSAPTADDTPTLDPATELISEPQPVTGFGAVGVTWSPDTPVDGDEITLQVRTSTADAWSGWEEIPYEHAEGGAESPEADTTEEAGARPGTELLWVGEVDQAQVRIQAPDGLPADVRVAVIDPGASHTTQEAPEFDATTEATPASVSSSEGDLALASGTSVRQPSIYSRAQWGADESIRGSAPSYAQVKGAVIHHTVNANNYTQAQVPSIIRGIYTYHVRSQGWSDVGYNFLVDKFGRLWEGRYGGITRAVRGAHISAHNNYAFGISAIGNYETAQPTAAMVEAIAQLIAWKLSYHGISATSTQTWGSVRMPAIIGHRDGGQTACPGRYLYSQLGNIRKRAAQLQNSSSTPAPQPGVGITYSGATWYRHGSSIAVTYSFTGITSGSPWVSLKGIGAPQYQNVRNNRVTFHLPANAVPRTHRFYLTLNNNGPGNGQTLTRTVKVEKGFSNTFINVAQRPTPSRGGTVKTAVTYQGNRTAQVPRPSGNVVVQVVRSDGTLYWKAPLKWMNVGWLDNRPLPKLPRGTYTVQTIYQGASTVHWSYASQQITVR